MRAELRRSTLAVLASVAAASVALPAPASAQYERASRTLTADFTLNGIEAWNTAKTHGFTFRPLVARSGQRVSRPHDGVNTRLYTITSVLGRRTVSNLAQVTGGNPSVSSRGMTATFEMFGAQKLAPGWSIQGVSLSGSFTWDRRPQAGTTDPSFRIKITGPNSVSVRRVVLKGPAGADWRDAFVGRKTYTINGLDAWSEARRRGFIFRPQTAGAEPSGLLEGPSTPLDGLQTHTWLRRPDIIVRSCQARPGHSYNIQQAECLVASVTGGNASVLEPVRNNWLKQRVRFEYYAGRRLAPGWTVRSVNLSGGSWIMEPRAGTDDLRFMFELTSHPGAPASATVRSIVLEGPSNATGWREAFAGTASSRS